MLGVGKKIEQEHSPWCIKVLKRNDYGVQNFERFRKKNLAKLLRKRENQSSVIPRTTGKKANMQIILQCENILVPQHLTQNLS